MASPAKRSKYSSLECTVCYEEFDANSHAPLIGTCGHSLCAGCCSKTTHCPICKKKKAFDGQLKNFTLIDLIEEKQNEESPKRLKNACSGCNNLLTDTNAYVCGCCIRSKSGDSIDEMIREVDKSRKVCADCARSVEEHGGHHFQQQEDIKNVLLSKKVQLFEQSALAEERFAGFHVASKIATATYEEFVKACTHKGRLTGDEEQFAALGQLMRTEKKRLFDKFPVMSNALWNFTKTCVESTEKILEEKKKMQPRNFTMAERSIFRSLPELKKKIADVPTKSPTKKVVNWKRMDLKNQKAMAEKERKSLSSETAANSPSTSAQK